MPTSAAAPAAPRHVPGVVLGAGRVVGAVLGAGFGALARVRRTKPLHPAGQVGTAVLEVTAPAPQLGVPLLSAPARHECLVRWSRSAGVPSPLPDVEGLALRVTDRGDGRPADLLFAGSGRGRWTRHAVLLRGPHAHGPMSTLLPVLGPAGSLLLLVEPRDDDDPPVRWRLAVASAGGDWCAVGTVEVVWGPDQPIRFDPVLHPLPGTRHHPLLEALREPAYAAARSRAAARTS